VNRHARHLIVQAGFYFSKAAYSMRVTPSKKVFKVRDH